MKGGHTTLTEHMPSAHRAHAEWTPSRILVVGGQGRARRRATLCEAILAERPHPEQGYRSCLGILRLGKRYGEDRLEAACARALRGGARSYRHVESILKHGLDRVATRDEPTSALAHARERARARLLPLKKGEDMLTEPTIDKLHAMRLGAMAAAWTAQREDPKSQELDFDERFGLLVDAEHLSRDNKRLARALREAKLRIAEACVEDIDYSPKRELDRACSASSARARGSRRTRT